MKLRFSLILALTVLAASCAKKSTENNEAAIPDDAPTYFSIKQFIQDQWDLYSGQPIVLTKVVTEEGKTESTLVSGYKMNLGEVMETFVKTDIGDKKFLGKYDFNVVDDDVSFTRSYYYDAKDPELYTQKLQIITNPENRKIKTIFIEAGDKQGWTRTRVKLYYSVGKTIRIQKSTKSKFRAAKETTIEYRFPETDSYY